MVSIEWWTGAKRHDPLRRAQMAVYAAFFANGFAVGHWAPKIPFLVDRLGISESMLGRMIILFGVGAVVALLAGAWCVTRFGSGNVLRVTSAFLVPALVLMTWTDTVFTATLALLWLGVFLGAMDNAMNAHGVAVEVKLARPVMSSYHGFWSLGGVAGGLTGGAMIVAFGEMGHAVLVSLTLLGLVVWAWPRYLADDNLDCDAFGKMRVPGSDRKSTWLPRRPGIYFIGAMTLIGFAPEGTIIDWSALYLRDELSAPVWLSGYAVAAFAATMAMMRLSGDRMRSRFGDRHVYVLSVVVAAIGLWIAGMAGTVLWACIGFFISGLGMANVVPILFSAAGRFPGVAPAIGIAVATTFGYAGLLFLPAFVGVIAENHSIGTVFVWWPVLLLPIMLGVRLLRM